MIAAIKHFYTQGDGLRLKITLTLALKIAFLTLLWWLFFSPEHKVHIDGAKLEERLLSPSHETR